jgi:hypothetical protein
MAQAVELLPSKHEALSSSPSTGKGREEEKGKEGREGGRE